MTAWFLSEQQGPSSSGKPATLGEVLIAYEEAHGKNVASAADVKISSRLWTEHFGAIEAQDIDVDRVERFKAWLLKRDYSPGYVNRVLSVGRAALMRAFERRVIPRRPVVKGVSGYEADPKGEPLSIGELRRLLAELHEPHLRRFFLLGLGTGARPDALRGLEWPQVDVEGRSMSLNPPGRTQTKKRRAKVPICDALAELLEQWGREDGWEGPVVRFKGNAVGSVKTSWRKARARAGMGEECNPYSLRHTVGKWLRSQGVPPWEVAALLGHKMPSYTITERYAEADPNHMAGTKAALDRLLKAVLGQGVSDDRHEPVVNHPNHVTH